MTFGQDIDTHFWLTRGMARRLGVNLTEAMHQGFITRADFAEMISRCRTCPGPEGCAAYQAETEGGAECPPDWCRNASVLNGLRGLS